MLAELVEVVIGVDTHKDTHSAAVLAAGTGAVLAEITVCADPDGYTALLALGREHGVLRGWAIEGTGGYGAGLARHLAQAGELVVELDRPARPARRAGAKSDPIDAVRAARDALARARVTVPRADGERASLQIRLSTRQAAVDGVTEAKSQLHALVISAPEQVRAKFRGLSTTAMLRKASRLRPARSAADVHVFTALSALRALALRITLLQDEADAHEAEILAIVRSWRPDLLELPGVGPIVSATVLSAWSHPGRVADDGAFAMLAGTAPIPASSGRTIRHRLNRSGDRRLNSAIHTIAVSRMRFHPPTRAYVERRRTEGKTDPEIRRCLKRYITRQLYRQLEHPPAAGA
ncbi:IS110 family transposase [Pseudonocardia halophobica]|nr:IS110 family transposase [Pseudonocardia halophobica]